MDIFGESVANISKHLMNINVIGIDINNKHSFGFLGMLSDRFDDDRITRTIVLFTPKNSANTVVLDRALSRIVQALQTSCKIMS